MAATYPTTTELGDPAHLDSPVVEIFIAIDVLFIIAALIGNILIISAIVRNKSLRTPQILFIISVAVSHILVGIIVLPMFVLGHNKHEHMNAPVCKTFAYVTKFSSTAALAAIIPLTIDAFLRNKGYYNKHPLTWQRSGAQVAATWIFAALYAVAHCYYVEFHIETGEDEHGVWHAKMCHIPDKYLFEHKVIIMVDFVVLFLAPVILLTSILLVVLYWFKRGVIPEPASPAERKRRRLSTRASIAFLIVFTCFNLGNYLISVYVFWGPGSFRQQHILSGSFALLGFCMTWVNVVLITVFNKTFRITILGKHKRSETIEMKDGKQISDINKNAEEERMTTGV